MKSSLAIQSKKAMNRDKLVAIGCEESNYAMACHALGRATIGPDSLGFYRAAG
jgi:hypothetical protein